MNPSLFYVSFFLFIITSDIASATQDAVKDATGKKVLNGVPYHIGPVTAAKGGGFKLTNTMHNKTICPFDVVQDPSASNLGDTFMFTLITEGERLKYLLTNHNLGIDSGLLKGPCDKSTFWTIPDAEAKAPENLITTGGSFEEDITCFQLVEYPKPTNPKVHSYMLQHCPYHCGGAVYACFNVSIYVDKGVRRLASTGTPFEFVFHKVPN
ncbi:miraculin-like [Cynara cardunculus var. scolymus]|uniref:miraculin-like n=1 Tax=Cynara cardunculus var. scolymus TaxID=59895 RepID=UPI000D62BAAF|nr:miraculin-like [Cynara cardunculus var. scolymus]